MPVGAAKYGMTPQAAEMTSPDLPFTGASNGAVTGKHARKFLDATNPELWLVGIGAATLGLIAVSTSVRVGPLHLSASAG